MSWIALSVRSVSFNEGTVMRVQTGETPASVVAFAPKKGSPDATTVADDAGHGIVALVQKRRNRRARYSTRE
jgi:hypothetical protein